MSKTILTPEYLNSLIIKEEYVENTVGGKVWLSCYLWVAPTHAIVGEPCSAMYPETSDPAKARQVARKRAFDQLWALEAYRLMVNEHRESNHSVSALEERIRRIEAALQMPGAVLTYAEKLDAAMQDTPPTAVTPPETPANGPGVLTPRELTPVTELTSEISRYLVRLEDEVTNICGAVMKLKLYAAGPVTEDLMGHFSTEFQEQLRIEANAPGFDADSFDVYAFCRNLEVAGIRVEADILNRSNTAWVDSMTMEKVTAGDTPDDGDAPQSTIDPIIVGDGLLQGFRVTEYLEEFKQAKSDIEKSLSQRAMLSVRFGIDYAHDEEGRKIYWELDELKNRFDNALSNYNFAVANPSEEISNFLVEVFALPKQNFKVSLH